MSRFSIFNGGHKVSGADHDPLTYIPLVAEATKGIRFTIRQNRNEYQGQGSNAQSIYLDLRDRLTSAGIFRCSFQAHGRGSAPNNGKRDLNRCRITLIGAVRFVQLIALGLIFEPRGKMFGP